MIDKEDLVKASKKIGLTNSQVDKLWENLQEVCLNKPKSGPSTSLLYLGAIIAFLSMTWLYTAHLENIYSLFIAMVYGLVFFIAGFYFWHIKKLRVPGGVLSSLGIVMVPLIVYSLQNVMHWWPKSALKNYTGLYYWIHSAWVPMEICTLAVALIVLYFIRFPFITVIIYFTLSFTSMDAIYLFRGPEIDHGSYYCIASITIGMFLNILGFILYRKDLNNFGFWSYLFGASLCWIGCTGWEIQTEWGYFLYFLMNCAFLFLSTFLHRKIFLFFGSLGIMYYMGHLTYMYSDFIMFSYVLGAIGFSIIMIATFLMHSKKNAKFIKFFRK